MSLSKILITNHMLPPSRKLHYDFNYLDMYCQASAHMGHISRWSEGSYKVQGPCPMGAEAWLWVGCPLNWKTTFLTLRFLDARYGFLYEIKNCRTSKVQLRAGQFWLLLTNCWKKWRKRIQFLRFCHIVKLKKSTKIRLAL